jgi:pimeloyl-ACP methyl ester carboxylesterase
MDEPVATGLTLVDALRERASVHLSPCGVGHMVWHVWGEGRPLLLLHGGSGSWTHWVRNIDSLVAAGYQVVAPDLPGFGDSAQPAKGSDADAMPDPLEAGLQTLLGSTPCDLSALDDVDRQAAARGFLVLGHHVGAGLAHGLDDLVQADEVACRRRAAPCARR